MRPYLGQMDMLYRLEDFMLAMIEQPLPADDLVGHAMVQESLRTPICLDEGVASLAQAEMAMELQSCKYVNLKPGRVGGLTPAVAIHDLCHEHCTPCWVGAMPQSAVGGRIGFAGRQSQLHHPADFFPRSTSPRTSPNRSCPSRMQPTAGSGCISALPGIGVEPMRRCWRSFVLHE